ncbi:MAG: PD-(D/E)XK nuclease family protein, partial [Phycisphaerae bacterium]
MQVEVGAGVECGVGPMAVRFVFGRSGSGKTWRCLEAVRAELRRSAIDGPPLILLVPEQASLQIERALIETGDLAGFTRCEVLSFRRLAQRLFEQAGGLTRTVLSRAGRQMVLRYLLERHQAELRFFGRVRDRAGLAGRLGRTVRELIEQEVRPESLGAVPAELLSESPVLAAKLADLRVIYGAYLEYLGRDRADPAEQLSLARQRLEQCQWLRGALVWVDGFAGFTVQQREFLVGLARQAERMEIALLMDPQAAVIERADEPIEPFDLFAPTEQTYLQLRGRLLAEGLEIEPPVRLVDRPGRRFAGSPVLARLEESLWSGGGVGERPEGIGDAVRLVEAPNRRAEVDAAVREILWLTRDRRPPLRYRDIAVIVRELEPYHDLLAACLGEHDVPFFIDRRQPTGHHPVVRLVRSAMVVLEEDLSVRAVGELLKTGLSGLTDEQADQLENYVLAQGIAGRGAWGGPDWRYQRYFRRGREEDRPSEADRQELREINDSRRRLMDVLGEWLEPGAEARLTV